MPFERDRIAAALSYSWSLKTSEQWTPRNPARGQCNVTALLLNELFGGEILKTPLPEGDHFYNRIEGERVDLTDSQFAAPPNYLDVASKSERSPRRDLHFRLRSPASDIHCALQVVRVAVRAPRGIRARRCLRSRPRGLNGLVPRKRLQVSALLASPLSRRRSAA